MFNCIKNQNQDVETNVVSITELTTIINKDNKSLKAMTYRLLNNTSNEELISFASICSWNEVSDKLLEKILHPDNLMNILIDYEKLKDSLSYLFKHINKLPDRLQDNIKTKMNTLFEPYQKGNLTIDHIYKYYIDNNIILLHYATEIISFCKILHDSRKPYNKKIINEYFVHYYKKAFKEMCDNIVQSNTSCLNKIGKLGCSDVCNVSVMKLLSNTIEICGFGARILIPYILESEMTSKIIRYKLSMQNKHMDNIIQNIGNNIINRYPCFFRSNYNSKDGLLNRILNKDDLFKRILKKHYINVYESKSCIAS